MKLHLSNNSLRNLKGYKSILLNAFKVLTLFVAALYLLGFTIFPLLGVGNYQLVRVDALLPSEWVMLIFLSGAMFAWSFHSFIKLWKNLPRKN